MAAATSNCHDGGNCLCPFNRQVPVGREPRIIADRVAVRMADDQNFTFHLIEGLADLLDKKLEFRTQRGGCDVELRAHAQHDRRSRLRNFQAIDTCQLSGDSIDRRIFRWWWRGWRFGLIAFARQFNRA